MVEHELRDRRFYFATSFVMDYTPESRFARRDSIPPACPPARRGRGRRLLLVIYPGAPASGLSAISARGAARLLLMRQITQRILPPPPPWSCLAAPSTRFSRASRSSGEFATLRGNERQNGGEEE